MCTLARSRTKRVFSIFTPVSAGDTVAKHSHPLPHTLARPHPSLSHARPHRRRRRPLPRPLSLAPPLPELLPLPRARRRRSPAPAPSLKMRFSPLRLSDLQWRCSICGGDYQDGATELLLPVACPELLLPVACPELLLSVVRPELMPTSPSPSRSSSSSSSVTSPPQHQRRGCWEGEGWMGPSSSRTTITEQSRKLVSEVRIYCSRFS
jgi:hypothetical protein